MEWLLLAVAVLLGAALGVWMARLGLLLARVERRLATFEADTRPLPPVEG